VDFVSTQIHTIINVFTGAFDTINFSHKLESGGCEKDEAIRTALSSVSLTPPHASFSLQYFASVCGEPGLSLKESLFISNYPQLVPWFAKILRV
jgi:hypothetical protein